MKKNLVFHKGGRGAFSLVEVLVAMAIFLFMAVMVASITGGVSRIAGQSQRRMGVDGGVRQSLSRISADFSRAIIRSDLPFRIEKKSGNDGLMFPAAAEGYSAGRGITMLGYQVANATLQRGAEATTWTANGATALSFTSVTNALSSNSYLSIDSSNYEILEPDIFRMEVAFLMGDGSIKSSVGTNAGGTTYIASFASTPRTESSNAIRAVIVTVAAVDSRARALMTPSEYSQLADKFSDATPGSDPLTAWKGYLTNSPVVLPQPVREGIRIYQRYIYIDN
ncbi:MAG: prepilin-type N-terminal cleavage/methylation domain-containing protein [Proteobacteria bacterium]|nr:prepilin-type N-terminal cleavage/methylation domain-containing protein [Pseudomonadota bacterium]